MRELYDDITVCSFSWEFKTVPPRRGFALGDAIKNSQEHGSTYLRGAFDELDRQVKYDMIVIITDEQSHDGKPKAVPRGKSGYLINVAVDQNGVGYGDRWNHIDGFSESVIKYILAYESKFINRDIA